MESIASRRRRLYRGVRESLRDVNAQISVLNQQVRGHLDLKGADLECFDLIDRTPDEVRTPTPVRRLERGGWIHRERDPDDRRGVVVRPARDRLGEVLRLYSGMNSAMDQICAEYADHELELLAGFLRRTAEAGAAAAAKLAEQ